MEATKSVSSGPNANGTTALAAGTPAPELALKSTPDQVVRLSELRGRAVILVFYPSDWSSVCGDQAALYNELLPEFQELDAKLLGISVDGVWCHAAFRRDRKLHFPLFADFEVKGAHPGSDRCADQVGRVWRLRMSVLRRGVSGGESNSGA